MMEEAIFISSLVAQVKAERSPEIRKIIEAMPYTEIPLFDDKGKLVVLLDAPSLHAMVEITDTIKDIPDVYSVFPVYQHDEKADKDLTKEPKHEIQIPVMEGRT